MGEDVGVEVMLDPSMLLHQPTFQLLRELQRDQNLRNVVLPSHFVNAGYNTPNFEQFFGFFTPLR